MLFIRNETRILGSNHKKEWTLILKIEKLSIDFIQHSQQILNQYSTAFPWNISVIISVIIKPSSHRSSVLSRHLAKSWTPQQTTLVSSFCRRWNHGTQRLRCTARRAAPGLRSGPGLVMSTAAQYCLPGRSEAGKHRYYRYCNTAAGGARTVSSLLPARGHLQHLLCLEVPTRFAPKCSRSSLWSSFLPRWLWEAV